MQKNLSVYDKTQACQSEIQPLDNQKKHSSTIYAQTESEQNTQGRLNSSMDTFCYEFCRDYFQKTNQTLTIQDLSKHYGVKNRRVYDLFGILEGFSFASKMRKKGTYLWIGIQNSSYNFHFEQDKPVALKDIAGLLRLLLVNCKKGLTIKQLNQKIILKVQEKTKRNHSKLTITRRIYECLKVMKTFGMVQKSQNLFKIPTGKIRKPKIQPQQCTSIKKISAKKEGNFPNCLSKKSEGQN